MTKHIDIQKIDIDAELAKYDAEQAQKAKEQAEREKQQREAKIAELKRKAKINEQLQDILTEQNPEMITDTLNTLLPWVIHNLQLANTTLVNELAKKSGKKTTTSKEGTSNLGRTYLVLDATRLKTEHADLYNALSQKTGVKPLQENNDYLVVTSKNYGAAFKNLVEEKGFKAIPKSKGQKEISATNVMLQTYAIAKKTVDDKTVETLEVVAIKPLNDFDTPINK